MSGLAVVWAIGAGLLAPGLFLGRLGRSKAPLETGFVLSLIALFVTTLGAQLLGLPLTWWSISLGLLGIGLGAFWLDRRTEAAALRPHWLPEGPRWGWVLLAGVSALLLFRCAMQPLTGFDTVFRWGYLAELMLEEHTLDFYPPRSAADFSLYFYIDGIPPLVSTVYWWLYAHAGEATRRWTAVPVVLQWVCAAAFAWRLAAQIATPRAGAYAATAVVLAPLFLRSVAIGQEAGLVALGVIAGAYFVECAGEGEDPRSMALAGASFALAPLAREWGWVFLACAGWLALRKGRSWQDICVLIGVSVVCAAPWYLRNAVLTGNPLYDLPVGTLFSVNPVHEGIVASIREHHGWGISPGAKLAAGAGELLGYAPLQILVGIPCWWFFRERLRGLTPFLWMNLAMWFMAVPYATGGVIYTTRVLAPALILLSLPIGFAAERALEQRWGQRVLIAVAVPFGAWALLVTLMFPARPGALPVSSWPAFLMTSEPVTGYAESRSMPAAIPRLLPPGTRILSPTNSASHVALRGLGFDVVPCWSPDVASVFSDRSYAEVRSELRERGIHAYLHDPRSSNNAYLHRFPFFQYGQRNWLQLGTVGGQVVLAFDDPSEWPQRERHN